MRNKDESKGFCVFYDWVEDLDYLSGEDAWSIIKAISAYYLTGTSPVDAVPDHLKPMASLMFHQIKRQELLSEEQAAKARKTNEIKKAKIELLRTQCERSANAVQSQSVTTETETNTETETETNTKTNTKTNTNLSPSPMGDECSERFDKFWEEYPRKVGKAQARKVFMKLKPSRELTEEMISAVRAQRESEQWKKDGGQFIPYPSTWLTRGQWEDKPAEAFARVKAEDDLTTSFATDAFFEAAFKRGLQGLS